MTVIAQTQTVALYIYGDELEVTRLTETFGINPSVSKVLGDVHYTSRGQKVVQKTGLWKLRSSKGSKSVSEAFDELVPALEKISKSGLLKIGEFGIEEFHLDIFVCASVDKELGSAEFEFSANQLALISALGAPLKITASTIDE